MNDVTPSDPVAFYAEIAQSAGAETARRTRILERVSLARLAAAVGSIAAAGTAVGGSPDGGPPWALTASVLALAFVGLVAVHRRARTLHDTARRRRGAAEAGLARIARDWAAMPAVRWVPPLTDAQQVLARDLGVTGDISLHRLVDMTTPALGSARAVQWLVSDPPAISVIAARAASVAALRTKADDLLRFAAAAHGHQRILGRGVAHFTAWLGCSSGHVGTAVPTMLAATSALAAAVIIGILAAAPTAAGAATLVIAVQVTISIVARRRVNAELHGVGDAIAQLEDAIGVMSRVTAMADVPGRFGEVQAELRRDGAVAALADLRRLLDWNNIRYTPLAHWLLNASVGLDVYIWRGVRRWRARHLGHAAQWLDSSADAEALAALATLGFDHPRWCLATVHEADDASPLDARALGHPLLAPERLVANDLRLDGRGAVSVVSGSNMAGKTTYLRAAGLNTLLAQAGGPACAGSTQVRRCRVRTSVRIEDDLGGGVSLFMAEAMRLRAIVAEAEESGANQAPVLFLLDEILHGTNAHDRREATRLVLRRLTAAGASGLVTTHDPAIAAAGDRELHFRETISAGGGEFRMDFDYTARDGPATTANALAVLRMLGLD
ncbi:MAG: hypothetical protein H0X64_08540 [Gemmatimonadaceae bacterium]|nr:hypothetical protein [Gemmatimonadaceae bacterium]